MSVPPELVGAFRRTGLLLRGIRVIDYVDRLWLQTPEWFADISLLIPGVVDPPRPELPGFFTRATSFAGRAKWEAPFITWDHEVAPRQSFGTDVNPLVWDNGVVLECGTRVVDGEEIPFVEEWLRMTGDDVTWSAEVGDNKVRVEIDKWAIEVNDNRPKGSFESVRYDRTEEGWVPFGSVVI
jgi:hypothetical protein